MRTATGKFKRKNLASAAHTAYAPGVGFGRVGQKSRNRIDIEGSPLMVAQRKKLERLFGTPSLKRDLNAPSQFASKEEEENAATAQKKADDASAREAPAEKAENKTGIPGNVMSKMENSFNADFSGVRARPNSGKATQAGALAFTQGSDIHFAPGQFSPASPRGQALLGHELAHVVQQSEGRVRPTTKVAGMPVNDSPSLEREADALGKKAANG